MVASANMRWLQTIFNTLTRIFDQVGLRKNIIKTVGVVCQPCRASVVWSDKAYTRWMPGEGCSYKESQRYQVQSPEYGKDLASGTMAAHLQT